MECAVYLDEFCLCHSCHEREAGAAMDPFRVHVFRPKTKAVRSRPSMSGDGESRKKVERSRV